MRRLVLRQTDEGELDLLKKRLDIAALVIVSLLAMLISRLWYLQIHKGAEYSRLSESNRTRIRSVAAPRGTIMDLDGRIIVTNKPQFNIVWIKEDAPDPEEVIKRLARVLNEDISDLLDKVRAAADNPGYLPIRLKENIDWKALVYLENHRFELPGIQIEVLPARDYLYGNLASHTIGYLAQISEKELESDSAGKYQPGDIIGKMGIEKVFEDTLRGKKGTRYLEVDVHGNQQRLIGEDLSLPGRDMRLTLDIDLQQTAEEAMAGKAGAVVALEVDTGRILTLASVPGLNLDDFLGGISAKKWQSLVDDPLHPLINKTIQGQYPPGSTYKAVTALAGLTEKVITPDTTFYCSGSLRLGNRSYGCWKKGGHGAVNLHTALAQSCDVYFYQVGQRVGVDALARYARSLGLGEKTGFSLEHEKPGLIPTASWKQQKYKIPWQDGETLSIAIGQGFNLVTPLQLCRLMATIANGGTLYRPQLVEALQVADDQPLQELEPIVDGRALGSAASLGLIREGLVAAVNERHGTGGAARLENIAVGGKTGTAQVIHLARYKELPEKDVPYKYRDHAWFMCFAPAGKPEIAVAVVVEHGGHGGSAAAPVAKAVLSRYFEKQQQRSSAR